MRILPRLEVITPSDLLLPAENLIVPEVTVPRKGLKTRAFELLLKFRGSKIESTY